MKVPLTAAVLTIFIRSMAIKRRTRIRAEEEFQMAPMIDMVFLLLVFFMSVSTLVHAGRTIEVELPESEQSDVPDDLADRGTLTIDADGRVYIGAEAVTLTQLRQHLRRALAENPRLRVHVRADREAEFGAIKEVLRACAEAGAHDVIYATHQR